MSLCIFEEIQNLISANQGETKVAPAMVVHPEAERPEASMIGYMA